MGLDISIETDNADEVFDNEYHNEENNYFNLHSLSRTFCNFMCRQNLGAVEPELDQIGRLTAVDIAPIYQMENYGTETGEELEFYLSTAASETERQSILAEAQARRDALKGNISLVLTTINSLIDKLSSMDDLANHLNSYGRDALAYEYYFTDFQMDKGKGYIGNNFGQDLRNFKRFLEYAQNKGATTVYFRYG